MCLCVQQGTRFEVLCVDSRPSNAAEAFCKCLLKAGVPCSYMALNAVPHAMPSVTKVLLGASAVKSNGAVIARAGSAIVAMAAARAHKSVLVCAQSIKFHDDVQLDSITENERGPLQVSPSVVSL
jgi:translation initiation factor eIF-2B subunit delta